MASTLYSTMIVVLTEHQSQLSGWHFLFSKEQQINPIRQQSSVPEDTEEEKAHLTKAKIHSVTWKRNSSSSSGTSSTLLLHKTKY